MLYEETVAVCSEYYEHVIHSVGEMQSLYDFRVPAYVQVNTATYMVKFGGENCYF
jgi:hypothetical protein